MDRDGAGHVGQAGDVHAEREAGLLERLPDRRVAGVVERHAVVGVRSHEGADEPGVLDPAHLGRGLDRVLHRECADTLEPVGRRGAPVDDPVVVDPARPDRELGVLDAAQLEAHPGVHHRDVDALGVEHLHPLLRVEPGRVEVLVVTTLAEVDVGLARVAEAHQPPVGDGLALEVALVVAGGLVPPEADALLGQVAREARLPEVGRFDDVPVGVDDELPAVVVRRSVGRLGVGHERMIRPPRGPGNTVPVIGRERRRGDRG